MAESKIVVVVLLSSINYSTWKIQALIKEGLWSIVNGTKTEPEGNSESLQQGVTTIVLTMEPSLLYLVGPDPTDVVCPRRSVSA